MLIFDRKILIKILDIRKKGFNYLKGGLKKFFKKRKCEINIFILNLRDADQSILKQYQENRVEGLSFNIVHKGDDAYAGFYAQIGDDGISEKYVNEKLLPCGDAIVVASVAGTVAAAVFIAVDRHPIKGISADLVFSDGQAYIAYIYVKKAFRSKGLGRVIVGRAVQYCIENGYRECIMAIYADNTRSLNIAGKYGFSKVCVLSMTDQFFIKRYRCMKERTDEKFGIAVASENQKALEF